MSRSNKDGLVDEQGLYVREKSFYVQMTCHRRTPLPDGFVGKSGYMLCNIPLEDYTLQKQNELRLRYPDGKYLLKFWEGGGAYGSKGSAVLIGDIGGNKMTPVFKPNHGYLVNRHHAVFIGKELSSLSIHTESDGIHFLIERHLLKRGSQDHVVLDSFQDVIPYGAIEEYELSEEWTWYAEMLEVAIEKVREESCVDMRYGDR